MLDRLAVRSAAGDVTWLELPYTCVSGSTTSGDSLLAVAATPTTEPHVVAITAAGGTRRCSCRRRDLGLGDEWWSVPEPVTFPTDGGVPAHALLYRPVNPECGGPADDRPPLIVVIHGGPTSAARVLLRPAYQFWTSRGFAVVDVNHRGSTGYGRAFRELLHGQWGVVDVDDCAAVARHLVARGDVDAARLCIRGGSAGGFTTLAALAFQDVFAAGASHYGVADLGALARRHAQVRGPLPRRARRPVARGASDVTRRARRCSTSTASTSRWPCSRASTTRSCRRPSPR